MVNWAMGGEYVKELLVNSPLHTVRPLFISLNIVSCFLYKTKNLFPTVLTLNAFQQFHFIAKIVVE